MRVYDAPPASIPAALDENGRMKTYPIEVKMLGSCSPNGSLRGVSPRTLLPSDDQSRIVLEPAH